MPLKSTNNTKFYEKQHQKNKQPARLSKLDTEGVIGLSPPYKGTGREVERDERSTHKNGETHRFPRWASTFYSVCKVLIAFELPLCVAFVLRQF